MENVVEIVGKALVLTGLAWLVQTAGFSPIGNFDAAPAFFVAGAAMAGAGAAIVAWFAFDIAGLDGAGTLIPVRDIAERR